MTAARPTVVATRALFASHVARLEAAATLVANPSDEPLAPAALAARVEEADGLLCASGDRVDAALVESARRLRVVSTISVGVNHIDLDACRARGIVVTNTPDVLTETTADFEWALMMAAARRVTESEHWLRAGHWQRWALDQFLGADVHHATLGILGMGRIGQALARRAAGFSMPVIYHNRSRLDAATEAACGARYVARDELFAAADHLLLVLPYTPANRHTVGAVELARMKPTATLTNIARGGLVDEEALADALEAGRLGGAGLDVYEGEPAVDPRLLRQSRVVLTPHLGSASHATRHAMGMLAIDNLLAVLDGGTPPCVVA